MQVLIDVEASIAFNGDEPTQYHCERIEWDWSGERGYKGEAWIIMPPGKDTTFMAEAARNREVTMTFDSPEGGKVSLWLAFGSYNKQDRREVYLQHTKVAQVDGKPVWKPHALLW